MSEPPDPFTGSRHPGYLPPTPYAPPPPEVRRTVNVMAIITLVSIFFVTPLAPVPGVIALIQIERTGQRGRWMAWAGIIAGGIFIAVFVGLAIFLVIVMASGDWHF